MSQRADGGRAASETETLSTDSELNDRRYRFAHELFAAQVRRSPNRLAVFCGERRLTYRELDTRSTQLAAHLRKLGVARDTVVAIAVDRSLEMVVGILGVLKAGGTYVPLDPSYPKERLQWMVEDSKPAMFLSKSHLVSGLPNHSGRTLLLDAVSYASHSANSTIQPFAHTASDRAYVIYTSGSTGKPKGVIITQGNLAHYLRSIRRATGVMESDVYLHTASMSFSSSVRQLLLPLAVGASVVIATKDEIDAPQALFTIVKERGVTVVDLVPSYWRGCLEALRNLSAEARANLLQNNLRLILSASEPLLSDLPRAWRFEFKHSAQLVNMYGQTETTGIVATYPIVPRKDKNIETVPIGRPIDAAWIHLLDRDLRPVAFGTPGEICIGGATVGQGYLNQPELTAESFPPDPFAQNPDAHLFRTGDFGRLREDGTLEFQGRLDNQLKIRGHRVEPAETEAALQQHEGIREVAVTAIQDEEGNAKLSAYVAAHPAAAPAMRGHERYLLPNNMAVAQQNKHETDFFYKQIFVDQTNFRKGITLPEGACVVDVGANIGLFTLFVQQVVPKVRVYAFEPIPAIFESLKLNTSLYKNSSGEAAKLFQCGLAESSKEAEFTFYPNSTSQSGRYGDEQDERKVLRSIIENLKAEDSRQGQESNQSYEELVESRVSGQKIVCQLRTLSEVISEEKIDQIDLLKIDVEKSENDVLAGIDDEDWSRIRQIVIEAHDVGGQLERLLQLLRDRGYEVVAEQDSYLKGSNLYNVYATRPLAPAESVSERVAGTKSCSTPPFAVPVLVDSMLSVGELRRYLQDKLPDYLIPTEYQFVDELPRLPNGKIDRLALKSLEGTRQSSNTKYVAPHSKVEEQLARIWAEVLKREVVSMDDNFFDLGGDSILVTQIVSRAARAGLRLTPRQIFKYQTIAQLSAVLVTVGDLLI